MNGMTGAMRLAWLAAAAAAVAAVGALAGGVAAFGVAAVLAALGATWWLLPRLAHRAFMRGRLARSELLYRWSRAVRFDPRARAACAVSLAACALARDRSADALAALDRVDPDRLDDAARAAWLNNRAYALARSGRDLAAAVELASRAVALRPHVPGFRHTRGVALIAVGRLEQAIAELDDVWRSLADADSELEAERCFDLGVAWDMRGEPEYAADYFARAQRAAPESRWAMRAGERLRMAPPAARSLGAGV